jgi:hypothetical protein
VRTVVIGHHARQVLERDAAHAFLGSGPLPVRGREAAKQVEVLRAGAREERQRPGHVLVLITALAGHAVPVEVQERRRVLGEDATDAHAVTLALQVGEVPHVLDEREAAGLRPTPRFRRREPHGCPREQRGRGFEGEQECLEIAPVHGHASYPNTPTG